MDKRKRIVKVALTEAEYLELQRKKTRPQLARWLRETALNEQQNVQVSVSKERSGLSPEVARILAGMGNNLNQIAKQLNSSAKIGVLNQTQLIRALTEIASIENSLSLLRQFLIEQEQKGQQQGNPKS